MGATLNRGVGASLSRPLLLQSTGSRCTASVIVAHGPSCSAACGIVPDQSSNPCPLHWQADSQPLRHQGSPGSPVCCTSETFPKSSSTAKDDFCYVCCSMIIGFLLSYFPPFEPFSILSLLKNFLATLHSLRDLSSPTKDRTCAPCIGSTES